MKELLYAIVAGLVDNKDAIVTPGVDLDLPVQTMDVAGEFWAEVDTLPDYNRILAYVAAKGEREAGANA